jgi:uncharacterized OB-fold protein
MKLTQEQIDKLEEGGFIPHKCLACGRYFWEVPDVRAYCENCKEDE